MAEQSHSAPGVAGESARATDAVLRLFPRLALLFALLAGAQLLAYAIAPSRAVPSAVLHTEQLIHEGVDVLYFGDSTLYRGAPGESDGRTLPERVAAAHPTASFGTVAHDAFSPLLYAEFARFLAQRPNPPVGVIIPLNLRSFSVERDRRPEYQFRRETYFLRNPGPLARASFLPLASWGVVDLNPIDEAAFRATRVWDGATALGTVGGMSPDVGTPLNQSNTPAFIELCYRFELTPDHRQVWALTDMVGTLNDAGIVALFYITPIDVELGVALYGEDFRHWIERNCAFLSAHLQGLGARVLDLGARYGHEMFVLDHFPDAYLRDEGKDAVADQIASLLGAAHAW